MATENFDMDYWGLSYKQNFEFLLNNEKKEKYYIWNASETKIEYSLFSLNQLVLSYIIIEGHKKI